MADRQNLLKNVLLFNLPKSASDSNDICIIQNILKFLTLKSKPLWFTKDLKHVLFHKKKGLISSLNLLYVSTAIVNSLYLELNSNKRRKNAIVVILNVWKNH